MAESLWTLRQRVERMMGESITGTPSGFLTVNTFGCTKLEVYSDDYFKDWHGRFYSGTHKDISFVVTGFTQAGGICAFSPSVSVKTDSTDLFELIAPDFSADEINDAINLAISMVEKEGLQDKVDTTTEVVASTYEYPIPVGFLYIREVYQEDSVAGRYTASSGRMDVRHWEILPGSPAKLWFNSSLASLSAGRHLRLVGQQAPPQLATDAAICEVSPSYIVFQTKALLLATRLTGTESTLRAQEQMTIAQTMADRERQHLRVAGAGRRVAY